jgi:two-component system response regulator AtoC
MTTGLHVLVVDDEEDIRHMLELLLHKEGFEVTTAADGKEALSVLRSDDHPLPDITLTDIRLPNLDGFELLDRIEAHDIDTTVIVMTAFGSREMAVDAIKQGAYDYIDKPFNNDEIILTLLKAKERLDLERENRQLRQQAGLDAPDIVGESDALQDVLETARKVAGYDSTVLITGESGTGKELVARAIHRHSPRADESWVAVNCGAIPGDLLESELFGHTQGAFTDASQDKQGLFQQADGGTLFLDEIAELPTNLQVKLLRALQEGEVRPVGANEPVSVDVRVLAASLHDLESRVDAGDFREDLYYRLNVIQLHLPPLRERPEDIPALAEHFIAKFNDTLDVGLERIEPDAMDAMLSYTWPGNVRELENTIERAAVLADGDTVELDALPDPVQQAEETLQSVIDDDDLSIKRATARLEETLIRRALERTDGNRTHAADLLDISHRTLLYKLKDYDLQEVGKD